MRCQKRRRTQKSTCLGENDLDEMLEEEEEVLEALASYQQVRRAIREQKNNRGYFDSKSSGKGSSSKSGASWRLNFSAGDGRIRLKSTSERGAKVHVDVLKLRTRCAKCGVLSDPSRSHPGLLRIKVARDVYNESKPEDNVPFYDDFVKDLNELDSKNGPLEYQSDLRNRLVTFMAESYIPKESGRIICPACLIETPNNLSICSLHGEQEDVDI